MNTTNRLLELKAARDAAWDARLAALDAYNASYAAYWAYRAALDKELK